MEQINKYYFEIGIEFKSDYDVKKLEEILGVKASAMVSLKDAVGPVKTAKFFYKTNEFTEIYADELFERFLIDFQTKVEDLKPILSTNNGEITFSIVFTRLDVKPCISLSSKAISILDSIGARYDVDFI